MRITRTVVVVVVVVILLMKVIMTETLLQNYSHYKEKI
jgi:hypothetical protein